MLSTSSLSLFSQSYTLLTLLFRFSRSTLLPSASRYPLFPSLLISTSILSKKNLYFSQLQFLLFTAFVPLFSLDNTLPISSMLCSISHHFPISSPQPYFDTGHHIYASLSCPNPPFVTGFFSGIVNRSIPDNSLWFLLTCCIYD